MKENYCWMQMNEDAQRLFFPRWIPVTQRLPEENQTILIYNEQPSHSFCIGEFDGYDVEREYIYCSCKCYSPVKNTSKYWMPLPSRPEKPE
jgi:hypothetical protein